MSDKQVTEFPGAEIDVQWDGRLCIHVGECGNAKGDLFVGGREPWCIPDACSKTEVREIIERCPSGALTYRDKAGTPEQAPPQNTVTVAYNGPLYAHGDLTIAGAPADMPGLRFRVALCRCGRSANKPFCDNSPPGFGLRGLRRGGRAGDATRGRWRAPEYQARAGWPFAGEGQSQHPGGKRAPRLGGYRDRLVPLWEPQRTSPSATAATRRSDSRAPEKYRNR